MSKKKSIKTKLKDGTTVWTTKKVSPTSRWSELRDDGLLHRTDGPTIEDADGNKQWWVNGKLHRTDGPAIEDADGYKAWYLNGKRHRTDGPAIERANGIKEWYLNGKRHRTDGPAIERKNGYKAWFLNDKEVEMEDVITDPKERFWCKLKI